MKLLTKVILFGVWVSTKQCVMNATTNGTCMAKARCLSDVWAYGSEEYPICEDTGKRWANLDAKVCCYVTSRENVVRKARVDDGL